MSRDSNIVFGIVLVFFVFYLLFGFFCYSNFGVPNNTSDFEFHWNKLQGSESQDYKPLFYVLMLPFSWNIFVFWIVNIFFIIVFFPYLFYKISGSWWGALVYFCGISLCHQQIYAATFPSALVLIMFLIYWKMRPSPTLWIIFLISSLFLHSYGVYLFLLVGLVEFVTFCFIYFGGKPYWVGWSEKNNQNTCIPGVFLLVQQLNNVKTLIGCFFSQIPFPVALIGFFNLNNWIELFFVIVSFAAAIIDFRAIAVAQIFLGIAFARRVKEASLKFKIFVFIFLMFQLGFYLADFVLGTWKHL